MPDPQRSIQLSKLTQEFADSSLELKFQDHHWQERSQQNLTTAFIWMLVVGFHLFLNRNADWDLSSSLFYLLQFAGYGAIRWLSRRASYYPYYDALLTLTLTAMIMCVVSFLLLKPDNTVAMALFIMAPLVVTIALNIRFYYTILLVCIIISNYSWALHEAELYEEFNRLVATQMVVSAGIGLVIQRLINASRHHDYARLITEQHFNQEMTNARLAAEQANQQKSLFLAQASHDIRTPMTGVLGLSRLLQKTALNARQLSLLQGIEACSNTLTNLMNQLLDLSRIEQGVFKLEERAFQPSHTIQAVSQLLLPLAEEKNLTIETSIAKDADVTVHGDEARLSQILTNLISNSIQYTNQGMIGVHLKLHHEKKHHVTLVFEVSDSGTGIPADEQKDIFNSFYQSRTIRHTYGLGLGLSISRQLARALNGDLCYQKTPTSRSTFTLSIPVTILHENHQQAALSKTSCHTLSGHLLVVEDNRINSLVIKETLLDIQPDLKVDTAFDGEQAVDLCRHHSYQLILMDCMLPKMNGFTALRNIRDITAHKNTPVVAVTASASLEDERRCHEAGFNHFLPKPFKESELRQILGLHLTHQQPAAHSTPDYQYWSPQDCLKQMGGKHSLLVKVVQMALEDLPDSFSQLSRPGLPHATRAERIHHLTGTLNTLHVSGITPLLDQLKSYKDDSDPECIATHAKVKTQLAALQHDLKLWLSRQ